MEKEKSCLRATNGALAEFALLATSQLPLHRRMPAVLDLDPILTTTTVVGPLAMLRDQAF